MKQQPREVSLAFCIVMDLIGYATYSIPFLGEFADLVWAPISGLIFFRTFGGWKGAFGGVFNFVEEILPGLDFIPSFTITWALQKFGIFGRNPAQATAPSSKKFSFKFLKNKVA